MPVFVFNTSFYVADMHHRSWLQWLRLEMKPAMEQAFPGLPSEVFEVVSISAEGNRVFSLQWRCEDENQVACVDALVAERLADLTRQYGEGITHFSSVMQAIE
jgi:hypothetical protein